jgi:hypothetical protein
MKLSIFATLALAASCSAFSPQALTTRVTAISSSQMMAYELKAEPEGGEEIQSVATMTGSKMKNMGADPDTKDANGDVYTFWVKAVADGKMIKGFRTEVEKDASRKANFPGFRKGQIPPYAQPQMTMFSVQEGIIKTCEAAVAAYGLKPLSGEAGAVEVHEDVKDICKGYKVGTSVEFTATFSAIFDPEKQIVAEEEPAVEEPAAAVEEPAAAVEE